MQFVALRDCARDLDRPRGKVLEALLAQLTAVVANFSMRAPEEPFGPPDFYVTKPRMEAKKEPRMTPRRRMEIARATKSFLRSMKPC